MNLLFHWNHYLWIRHSQKSKSKMTSGYFIYSCMFWVRSQNDQILNFKRAIFPLFHWIRGHSSQNLQVQRKM